MAHPSPDAWIELVTLFIALLVTRKVVYGTVRVYLYRVCAWFMDDTFGNFDPLGSYRVQQCLTGARRILKDIPTPKFDFLFEFFAHIRELMNDSFIDKCETILSVSLPQLSINDNASKQVLNGRETHVSSLH
jgi:hypothetical protein